MLPTSQDWSFIKTVPMQHVQSHYTSSLLHPAQSSKVRVKSPAGQLDGSDDYSASQWQRKVTAQPFAPLLSLSPESSVDSLGADPLIAA